MEPVKFTRSDWPHCKREALLALAAATVGLALVGAGHHLYRTAEQSFQQADADLQAAQAALASQADERTELEASLPVYRGLAERSIIGAEDRLNWHETLKAEQQRQALGKVAFSLAPRRPILADEAGNPAPPGLFRPYRSTMKLGVEFQGEAAFVDFLEQVAGRAHALTIVRACRIGRVADSEPSAAWRLAAECTIDWATLEKAAPAGGANP